jgi:cytochrome oxidase Cu insertion factor (SCO1/SenC/PrrC family)
MNRSQLSKLGIAGLLTSLFLVACGNTGTAAIAEVPSATSPPEKPSAGDALHAGDVAPDFTLTDNSGNMVSLTDELLENEFVALVFYHGDG